MASLLNPFLPFQVTDGNGTVAAGAKVYVYDAGTTTNADVYLDSALSSQHPQPVVADSNGFIPLIYTPTGQEYKYILRTSADVEIITRDNLDPYVANGGGNLPVGSGGTGSSTPSGARANLGAASDSDLTILNGTVSGITTPQSLAEWQAGTSSTETVVSPAKVAASVRSIALPGYPAAILYERQSSGVGGGTASGATWNKRSINAKIDAKSLVTLNTSTNVFSFAKNGGILASSPAFGIGGHRSRLYNNTDDVIAGNMVNPNGFIDNTVGLQTEVTCIASVEAGKDYQLDHYTGVTRATTGLGVAMALGIDEHYATIYYFPDL